MVVELEALSTAVVPFGHGPSVQGAFLGLLGKIEPGLADALHQGDGIRAYTCSPLDGPVAMPGERLSIACGQRYRLRFTGLNRRISAALLKLAGRMLPVLRVDAAEFRPVSIAAELVAEGMAQHLDYADLLALVQTAPALSEAVAIEFLTPTSFNARWDARTPAMNIALPRPDLVFRSLGEKWLAFAPRESQELFSVAPGVSGRQGLGFFTECVVLTKSRIGRFTEQFSDAWRSGFLGHCEFALTPDAPPHFLPILHVLATYSFFAGVGRETTRGRGQARPVTLHPAGTASGK